MRTAVTLAIVAFAGLLVMGYILRWQPAMRMMRTLRTVGWAWVVVVVALGLLEAWRRWA